MATERREENPVEREVKNVTKVVGNWGKEELAQKAEEIFYLQALKASY